MYSLKDIKQENCKNLDSLRKFICMNNALHEWLLLHISGWLLPHIRTHLEVNIMVHALINIIWEAEAGLVNIVSSRIAMAIETLSPQTKQTRIA